MVEGLSQPTVVQQKGSRRINTPSSLSYFLPVSCQVPYYSRQTKNQRAKGPHRFNPPRSDTPGHRADATGGREVWTGKGKFPGTLALNWNCREAFAPLGLEIQRQIEFGGVNNGDLFLGLRSGRAWLTIRLVLAKLGASCPLLLLYTLHEVS